MYSHPHDRLDDILNLRLLLYRFDYIYLVDMPLSLHKYLSDKMRFRLS